MRRILSALAFCALGFAANSEPASAEITYPWCAQYDGGHVGSARNCSFRELRTRTLQDRPHGRPRMTRVDVVRYGFIGRDSQPLLPAGLPAQTRLTHTRGSSPPEHASGCRQSGMQ
jgi:hypothetical protein